jgi:3-oxoacyl-[acyl-carrier-protein] synthase II
VAARRIVITGTGLITALGTGTEKSWAGLLAGKSGVGPVTKFDPSQLSARIAGEVKDFHPEEWGMERREWRRMDLFTQYAVAASEMAMRESGLPIGTDKPHGYEPEKVAVIIGSGIGGIGSLEEQHKRALEKGFDRISPFFILQMIINMAPGHVSIRYGAKGPNWSPVSACATSAHAIGEALKSIRIGETDAAIAGGAEASITPLSIGGFAVMKALSTRNDDPGHASRPFDKDRDGFVMGEGAGVVVLEELEHARRRGANILAEVVGYGANSDAFHETKAIKTVFGPHAYKLMVSSTKSMTAHMLGAAGGAEAVVSALALARGVIPPTANYVTPDPECDLDYVPNTPREVRVNAVLSNSFGFGGTNGVLIFKRFK